MNLRINKIFVCISAFVLCFAEVRSQKIVGKDLNGLICVKPCESFKAPLGSEENEKCTKSKTVKHWVVYSDREENQTYLDPNFSKPSSFTLTFMEPCYVAQEQGSAVRLVKYNFNEWVVTEKGRSDEVFKANAEDLGWISKTKLLLWQNSLIDSTTTFSKKAISVKRLTDKNSITNYISRHGILDLFNAPVTEAKNDLDKELKMFQYLFVYKEENNMYLLGKLNEIYPTSIGDEMLGWAPKSQVQLWNDAICLRINFDAGAMEERQSKKFDVKFFESADKARAYRKNQPGASLPFNFDDPSAEDKAKDNPYLLGYPIIDGSLYQENIYKTGYITNTVDNKGNRLYTVSKGAINDQIMATAQSQKDNVTIVLVLDGSARSFIRTVASAIQLNPTIGNIERTRNDYSLAAVIYNDAQCGNFNELETIRKVSNKNDFLKSLNEKADNTPPCNFNRETNGAPVFNAIKKACSWFNDSTTTNVIIFVGSVADKDSDLKPRIIQELIKKQVKMLFIQLSNKNGNLYDNFLTDAQDLMVETSKTIDKTIFQKEIAKGSVKEVKWSVNGERCELQNSAIPGVLYNKPRGQSFSSNEVKDYVTRFLINIENKLNDLIHQYGSNNSPGDQTFSSMDESTKKEFELYYKNLGYSERDVQNFLSGNTYKLFIEGYTSLTCNALKFPIFNKSLFLSKNEFGRLLGNFESLSRAASAEEGRQAIIESYRSIIKSYKGGDVSDKSFNKYTLSDMVKFITKLPVKNPLFEMKIEDVRTEKDEGKVHKISTSFKLIYDKLQQIEGDDLSKYQVDNKLFYWVTEKTFHLDD